MDDYCSLFSGEPADDEASPVRTIGRAEICDSAAIAQMTPRHGNISFTDYLSC